MRLRYLAMSCVLVAATAGSVSTLAASPDCARWMKEYQQALAHRASAAKRHVVHVAHRLVKPHPHLINASLPAHRLHPRLSPTEMVRRFRVLCGEDLPDETMPASFVPTGLETAMLPEAPLVDSPLLTDGGQPVAFSPAGTTPMSHTPGGPGTTPFSPIIYSGGAAGSPGTGGGGAGSPPSIIPSVPVTTPSPVPEPSSLLLLCTGIAAAVPLLRRRIRA